MIKDTEYHQDDKTVLLDRQGSGPVSGALTDSDAPPRFEQLEERMIFAAHLRPTEVLNISLNALVDAASDLLSEVVRLKHSDTREDLSVLHARLTSALKLFEAQALHSGIEESQVMTARYLLCTVVDEAVVTTPWGSSSDWSQMSLLSRVHNETFGGERFFKLLEQLSKNPVKHLPLLELIYLCLALGFEGKYRVQGRGVLELEDMRDALYRQIRQLRGDVSRELSPHWEGLSDQRRNRVRIVPAWTLATFTFVGLLTMYSVFSWVLAEQRESILQAYQPVSAVEAPAP
ncbi:type IVB secretion system protein IcmH/DotU [Pseudomonas sp. C32]|uniref:type IVB secretion system protein IcmH/DotU n=1 Tax=Pseudomonas sp. C32 TaxID=1529208 RepID=UPI002627BD61|nr:type IVB secretion system protein IcmH/DotU [Pseudomonas sp. C32]MDN4547913.1 type IVB secretion system protein IcmH/DotU [Pseudomonas sp. C32]